jgi:hypothetical protein
MPKVLQVSACFASQHMKSMTLHAEAQLPTPTPPVPPHAANHGRQVEELRGTGPEEVQIDQAR